MKTRIAKILGATSLAVILSSQFASVAMAEGQSKLINIRPANTQQQALQVDFSPLKSSYAVNEPIQFKIRGNKRFFLFMFNVDPATGQAVMILPNNIQTAQQNMYNPRQTLTVPNRNVEFYSDRPGVEKIIMVATTQWPSEIDMNQYTRQGNFMLGKAATVYSQVKAIRVRASGQSRMPSSSANSDEVYIKEFGVNVYGQQAPAISDWSFQLPGVYSQRQSQQSQYQPPRYNANSHVEPFVFLSVDRTVYRQGESMRMAFGADRDGYVNLYSRDRNGNYNFISSQAVRQNQTNYLEGYASNERGEQAVIAVYTTNGQQISIDYKSLEGSSAGNNKSFNIQMNSPETPTTGQAIARYYVQ